MGKRGPKPGSKRGICGVCGEPKPIGERHRHDRTGNAPGRPKGSGVVPLEERFWRHVSRRKTATGCLLWTGAKNRGPREGFFYGVVFIAKGEPVKSAHRVAWELEHGPIPEGMSVLHKCDRPLCVNHEHLFLGTQLDNVRDMIDKGRRGTRPPRWTERRRAGQEKHRARKKAAEAVTRAERLSLFG